MTWNDLCGFGRSHTGVYGDVMFVSCKLNLKTPNPTPPVASSAHQRLDTRPQCFSYYNTTTAFQPTRVEMRDELAEDERQGLESWGPLLKTTDLEAAETAENHGSHIQTVC